MKPSEWVRLLRDVQAGFRLEKESRAKMPSPARRGGLSPGHINVAGSPEKLAARLGFPRVYEEDDEPPFSRFYSEADVGRTVIDSYFVHWRAGAGSWCAGSRVSAGKLGTGGTFLTGGGYLRPT
ncbi:hypothetical protein SRHO_G00137330 [Serrasalmus rhombeus]